MKLNEETKVKIKTKSLNKTNRTLRLISKCFKFKIKKRIEVTQKKRGGNDRWKNRTNT